MADFDFEEKVPDHYQWHRPTTLKACEVEHVYGFAGDRYKSVLYFGKTNNEIVFPAASLGVVQDLKTRKQKIFGGL